MPPNKRIHDKTLTLVCEWSSCHESFSQMDHFCNHAETHFDALNAAQEDEEETEGVRNCLWRDCGFCSVDGPEELRRHLFFHCYHSKLKQLGQQVLKGQPQIGTCSICHQNCNLIPDIPDNFICLWEDCEQPPYENPAFFYRHVEMHSLCVDVPAGDHAFSIRCGWKDCEATAKGRPKLREHLRSHTQEKVVACPGCGGMYANNTKFFDHIIRQSAMEGQRFQCSHCSKRFATERLLRDHMRTHVSHYKCPLCDMTCPSPSSLRNHIKFRHSNEKPYSCDYCEYSCKNLIDLRKHLDTHISEPAFHCDVPSCGFTSRTLSTMNIHHKKEHTGNFVARYKCHVCEQCFTRGNSLTVHLHKKHQFKWPSGHPRFRNGLHLKMDAMMLHPRLLLLFGSFQLANSQLPGWIGEVEGSANTETEWIPQPDLIDDVYWSGSAPLCLAGCKARHQELRRDRCGDSTCCWLGQKSLCRVNCGRPDVDYNGVLHGNDWWVGSVVRYTCRSGFMLVGKPTRICQPNGLWTPKPTCLRMCRRGRVEISERELNGTCNSTCAYKSYFGPPKQGCSRIDNCMKKESGWKRFFAQCIPCICDCALSCASTG